MSRLLDTEVRYFDRETYNIPQIGNEWGSIVNFLDVTLTRGTEDQSVLSITTKEDIKFPSDYWISTIYLNLGHGFKSNLSVIEIKGCSEAEYNRVFRVQEVLERSITVAFKKSEYEVKPNDVFDVEGVFINQPPLGFKKVFSEPEKAVYKTTTKDLKIAYLRVDNSCPQGHDPTHAKFARVSMFEDMKNIDDYKYKRDRKKCPNYRGDENRVEEGVYQVWFSTRYSSYRIDARARPDQGNDHIHLVGDASTFYLYIKNIWMWSGGKDEVYCFGEYKKYCYKEDPLPFILRCSKAESLGSNIFIEGSRYGAITRDRDWCNNTFSTDPENMLYSNNSDSFALLLNDNYLSGFVTRVSFKPYQNELPFNISDLDLRFFRPGNTVLEGKYRGLKIILNNLPDNAHLQPRDFEVFNKEGKYYLFTLMKDYSSSNQKLLFQLNNWSES